MAVYKIHRTKGFTHLPNEVLEDGRISFRARGILAYLLSRPADWRANADHLQALSEVEGRKAVLTAMKELEQVGYIERRRVRDASGQIATVTDVYDRDRDSRQTSQPVDNSDAPESPEGTPVDDVSAGHTGGPSPNVGEPDAGAPAVGGGHSLTRTEEQEPPPPARARDDTPPAVDNQEVEEVLDRIRERLDPDARTRLDVDPKRPKLATAVGGALDRGWPPGRIASTVADPPLLGAVSVGAVLAERAGRLADRDPPARLPPPDSRPLEAPGLPPGPTVDLEELVS